MDVGHQRRRHHGGGLRPRSRANNPGRSCARRARPASTTKEINKGLLLEASLRAIPAGAFFLSGLRYGRAGAIERRGHSPGFGAGRGDSPTQLGSVHGRHAGGAGSSGGGRPAPRSGRKGAEGAIRVGPAAARGRSARFRPVGRRQVLRGRSAGRDGRVGADRVPARRQAYRGSRRDPSRDLPSRTKGGLPLADVGLVELHDPELRREEGQAQRD
jgi:hypothetical protein